MKKSCYFQLEDMKALEKNAGEKTRFFYYWTRFFYFLGNFKGFFEFFCHFESDYKKIVLKQKSYDREVFKHD